MKKEIIIGALLLIIGFVTGIVCRPHRIEKVVDIQRDTITKTDTHIVEKPIPKEMRITDTMYVAVTDTIRQRDTLYMRLEFETKTYKGEDYLAKVSGYNPSLYYIEVYPKTKIVTEKVTSYRPCNYLSIGVETNYMSSLSTPIYIEYERTLKPWLSVYGQIAYDLPSQKYGAGVGLKMSIGW